ncbi:MAG: hypothetical protein AAGN35_06635 [Bacteroidota bacterium]
MTFELCHQLDFVFTSAFYRFVAFDFARWGRAGFSPGSDKVGGSGFLVLVMLLPALLVVQGFTPKICATSPGKPEPSGKILTASNCTSDR